MKQIFELKMYEKLGKFNVSSRIKQFLDIKIRKL